MRKQLGGGLKYVLCSIPIWGNDPPIGLIFFRWVDLKPPTRKQPPALATPLGAFEKAPIRLPSRIFGIHYSRSPPRWGWWVVGGW